MGYALIAVVGCALVIGTGRPLVTGAGVGAGVATYLGVGYPVGPMLIALPIAGYQLRPEHAERMDPAADGGRRRALFETEPDVELVDEATNGGDAVTLKRRARPDIVLMDIRMSSTDALSALRDHNMRRRIS